MGWRGGWDIIYFTYSRNDERWSIKPSGAWISNADPAQLHTGPVWHYAGMLAQGPDATTHVRDAAVEVGGLFHIRPKWLQGSSSVLGKEPGGVEQLNQSCATNWICWVGGYGGGGWIFDDLTRWLTDRTADSNGWNPRGAAEIAIMYTHVFWKYRPTTNCGGRRWTLRVGWDGRWTHFKILLLIIY